MALDSQFISEQPFDCERDLIDTVLINIGSFVPYGSNFVFSTELEIGAGIVDILLGRSTKEYEPIPDTVVPSLRKLAGSSVVVLSYLYSQRPLTANTLAKRSGLDTNLVVNALAHLLELGLCRQPSTNTYMRTSITDQFTELISIEGKLQNWRKALQQAYRNRLFSTYSYVVLDARHARPACSNIDLFRNCGVGLALAGLSSQTISFVYKPNAARPISNVLATVARSELATRAVAFDVKPPQEVCRDLHHEDRRCKEAIP